MFKLQAPNFITVFYNSAFCTGNPQFDPVSINYVRHTYFHNSYLLTTAIIHIIYSYEPAQVFKK